MALTTSVLLQKLKEKKSQIVRTLQQNDPLEPMAHGSESTSQSEWPKNHLRLVLQMSGCEILPFPARCLAWLLASIGAGPPITNVTLNNRAGARPSLAIRAPAYQKRGGAASSGQCATLASYQLSQSRGAFANPRLHISFLSELLFYGIAIRGCTFNTLLSLLSALPHQPNGRRRLFEDDWGRWGRIPH